MLWEKEEEEEELGIGWGGKCDKCRDGVCQHCLFGYLKICDDCEKKICLECLDDHDCLSFEKKL